MSIATLTLTAALVVGYSAPHEAQPPTEVGERVTVEIVLMRFGPVDPQALRRALAARVPWIQLYTFGTPEAPSPTDDAPGRCVFVDIVARAQGYSTTFILSDGWAYHRDVMGGDGDIRELASAIANTLAAIEDAAIVPEPEPATLPETPHTSVSDPPQAESTSPSSQTDSNASPAKSKPTVSPEPEHQPDAATLKRHIPKDAPNKEGYTLGFSLAPAVAVLLAPGQLQGFSGFGGGLHGSLRFPRGLGLDIGVRILGYERDDLGLRRTRVGIATGYIHRNNHLELAGLAGFSIEPWQLRDAGERISLGVRPLVGGFANLALGYHAQVHNRLALRVGGRLGLAGSTLVSGRVPEIRRANESSPRLGLGGFELTFGLDLTLWISLAKG